jgi:NAD(P)-dependent dehydrogenase (short-subunit alcohol dehydrogenase family)
VGLIEQRARRTPPYLSPYFAAKAAMDSLAVSYAGEVARWGIETSIIVPGAFTKGTNHFAHSGRPADEVLRKNMLRARRLTFPMSL